jgi:hypothetical protein
MTSIKILCLMGLLGGLALGLVTDAPGDERPPEHLLGSLWTLDDKGDPWDIFRDGDRFVAVRVNKSAGILPPRNFKRTFADTLEVDDKYLGYDLRGENKNVLVRGEWSRQSDQDIQEEFKRTGRPVRVDIREDIRWGFVSSEAKSPDFGYFRVKNGELKDWWIGLGPVEPAKEGEQLPRNRQGPRAPLVLVKDKKDAAGFRWTTSKDEESR